MCLSLSSRAALVALTILLVDCTSTFAGMLINGDFSQGLTGYTAAFINGPNPRFQPSPQCPRLHFADDWLLRIEPRPLCRRRHRSREPSRGYYGNRPIPVLIPRSISFSLLLFPRTPFRFPSTFWNSLPDTTTETFS